jgi:phosphatidylglycerophosphatase GEP4
MPLNSNIPAFNLAVSTLIRNPSLLLPHLTIPTFIHLPEQLGPHLHSQPSASPSPSSSASRRGPPQIRALVIDKDNTLTPPHATTIPSAYLSKLHALRTNPSSPFNLSSNPHAILLVSNTSGSNPRNARYEAEARHLESLLADLKIPVFRAPRAHSSALPHTSAYHRADGDEGDSSRPFLKKPFSYAGVLAYLKSNNVVTSADEIAVVGDRLGTDVLMASLMGAWSVWVRDGVTVGTEGQDAARDDMDYRGVLAKAEAVLERYLRRRGVKPAMPEGWQPD